MYQTAELAEVRVDISFTHGKKKSSDLIYLLFKVMGEIKDEKKEIKDDEEY